MSALPKTKLTAEQYLAFERESEGRHEYLNGEIYDFAGASENHNLVLGSTYASLYAQLRKKPCKVYPSDMRVKVTRTGLYTYPDISVVCGTPQLEDDHQDSLLNPIVIVEVLLPSTERYDRGRKFQHYRKLDSLQEYVLIAQDSCRIEHFTRQADGQWLLNEISQLDHELDLPAIGCKLPAADVYEKVTFEDESQPAEPDKDSHP